MTLSDADIQALWLTLKLASLVTALLLMIATPLALWLSRSKSRATGVVNAVVALPLVLPPSVLGFYLLIAMGPDGPLGKLTTSLGLGTLPFTFTGLVIASIIYSLPFVVQPIQNALSALGNRPREVAATLGAGPWDTFFHVTLPLARPGFLTAAVLGFAHTVGEFGVVLMIGGNIPAETRVLSVQIYSHVEALQYAQAHTLSALMVGFSFVVLLLLYGLRRRQNAGVVSWS
ncbi:molybdate ABC transporter permease subunit [Thalassolituus oleivorans]|uniref:molybdate ABC transporter permease subunit n=1 Tax=Thalassolituus oleivorans TaxID=187493 RepID=UPI0023EFD878|nr:molybdate ABC transporter permease subunit [Thalassolituus oleivorans]|tara:strand:+ start:40130 stop:40822 length:693 start_codon:yes stop_codon:yes gene_type:complete